ncbi:MAG: hypothetical protein O3A63_07930 [Proteobacteria bacterium]|nr:hypothetical protein [Pseudomonadota bacterium]
MDPRSRQQAQQPDPTRVRQRHWLVILGTATTGFWISVVFASIWLLLLFAGMATLALGVLLLSAARLRKVKEQPGNNIDPELRRRKSDKFNYINGLRY